MTIKSWTDEYQVMNRKKISADLFLLLFLTDCLLKVICEPATTLSCLGLRKLVLYFKIVLIIK